MVIYLIEWSLMMIGQWCSIDTNKFCQEMECQGCQIYYSHLVGHNKTDVHPVKAIALLNSGPVLAKPPDISRTTQPV